MLKRLGDQLTRYVEKELASVLTTVNRHLAFLDSPAVADVTGTTSFDPAALLQGRASIYLVLPPDQLRALAGLMRLWVTGLLRFVTMQGESERQPVLFLLDEAGHLGRMQALEDALTLGRGGGVRLWFFFQSLGQLREAFDEKADTFLDNIDTQQFFGLNAISSAEMVSNRLGEATIRITSYQEGRNRSYSDTPGGGTTVQHGSNTSVTHSEMGRKLLKTEEVLQLPEDQAVIFTPGVAPILGTLLRYYEAPEFLPPGKLPRMRLMRKVAAVFLFLLGLAGVIGFALDVSAGPRGAAMPPRQQPAQRP